MKRDYYQGNGEKGVVNFDDCLISLCCGAKVNKDISVTTTGYRYRCDKCGKLVSSYILYRPTAIIKLGKE